MNSKLNVVFAGTPEFSVPTLRALQKNGYALSAVLTQPDRPAGRGQKLVASPVKVCARELGIPVWQPESLKSDAVQQQLADLKPDVMVVVAYGLLLPQAVLNIPRFGCINVHASLLPRWRGAAPIQRAILAGDDRTGVTIMQMDKGLDTGDILAMAECPIFPADTAKDLHDRLAVLGPDLLLNVLAKLGSTELHRMVQAHDQANYAQKLHKDEACIDWRQSAESIARQVRAFNPWPTAFTHWGEQRLKVWKASIVTEAANKVHADPGEVVASNDHGFEVHCGVGSVLLEEVQLPGGKRVSASAFTNAHAVLGSTLR